MMNRTISIYLLTFLLIAAFLVPMTWEPVHAAIPDFTDVPKNHWGRSYVSFSAELGIVNGYPMEDGSFQFRPDNSVSKEESMQMLYKAVTNSGIGPAFTEDLLQKYERELSGAGISAWARECVSYGLENGILEAAELASFRTVQGGAAPASREEVARWTGKAIGKRLMPATALDYADADQISDENRVYVDLLNRTKVMIGDSTGKFNPGSPIRRVEFAVICNRVYALSEADFDIDSESYSIQGTVTGINNAARKIYLTSDTGALKVIDIEDKIEIVINGKLAYNNFSSIPTGKKTILAWGPFDQLHVATQVVAGEATIGRLTPVSDDCVEAELLINRGERVYYYIDGETSIIDNPEEGEVVIFIADGIKIVEIATKE